MSDDDLGLGGLAPTTPVVVAKRKGAKPSSRAEPGPSKPKSAGRKRAAPESDSEIEEVHRNVVQDQKEVARATRKPPSRAEAPPVVNGKQAGKGKGKGKVPPDKVARQPPSGELIDVDGPVEVKPDTAGQGENFESGLALAINHAGGTKAAAIRSAQRDDATRLREHLRRAQDQVKSLERQLEEVFQVRETEAERLLEEKVRRYEAQLDVQQSIINELHAQQRQKEPLMRSGGGSVLNLLTREAADEEKKQVEEQVVRWKKLAQERQRTIEEKEKKIQELLILEQDLRLDLKTEIDRANNLASQASKVQSSASRGGRLGGIEDPKQTELIRLYEDLTNIIIPSIKVSKGKYLNLDEWTFSCVYSHNIDGFAKSLHFTLRCCWDESEVTGSVTSKDQLEPRVYYIPHDLDKEPTDFVERLEFLKDPFTFPRHQLAVFLRILDKTVETALAPEESVIEVEE